MALIFLKGPSKVNFGWNLMRKIPAGDGAACRPAVYETDCGSRHTSQGCEAGHPLSELWPPRGGTVWVGSKKIFPRRRNAFLCKHINVAFEWCVGGREGREIFSLPSVLFRWAFEVFHLAFWLKGPKRFGGRRRPEYQRAMNLWTSGRLFHLREEFEYSF